MQQCQTVLRLLFNDKFTINSHLVGGRSAIQVVDSSNVHATKGAIGSIYHLDSTYAPNKVRVNCDAWLLNIVSVFVINFVIMVSSEVSMHTIWLINQSTIWA